MEVSEHASGWTMDVHGTATLVGPTAEEGRLDFRTTVTVDSPAEQGMAASGGGTAGDSSFESGSRMELTVEDATGDGTGAGRVNDRDGGDGDRATGDTASGVVGATGDAGDEAPSPDSNETTGSTANNGDTT